MATRYSVDEVVTYKGKTGRVLEAHENDLGSQVRRREMNRRCTARQWVSNLGMGGKGVPRDGGEIYRLGPVDDGPSLQDDLPHPLQTRLVEPPNLKQLSTTQQFLLSIARCDHLGRGCCSRISAVQAGNPEHHLPEPWNGNLGEARILFMSSNPSIRHDEDYPTSSWSDSHIVDFFEHRYGGGRKTYMKDGVYALLKNGRRGRPGSFLPAVRSTARILLGREPIPGSDYAVTEIVHCKSKGEVGVTEAAQECVPRYFRRVLGFTTAPVVISLGVRARAAFGFSENGLWPYRIGESERMLVCLPHPTSWGEKRIDRVLSTKELGQVKALLA